MRWLDDVAGRRALTDVAGARRESPELSAGPLAFLLSWCPETDRAAHRGSHVCRGERRLGLHLVGSSSCSAAARPIWMIRTKQVVRIVAPSPVCFFLGCEPRFPLGTDARLVVSTPVDAEKTHTAGTVRQSREPPGQGRECPGRIAFTCAAEQDVVAMTGDDLAPFGGRCLPRFRRPAAHLEDCDGNGGLERDRQVLTHAGACPAGRAATCPRRPRIAGYRRTQPDQDRVRSASPVSCMPASQPGIVCIVTPEPHCRPRRDSHRLRALMFCRTRRVAQNRTSPVTPSGLRSQAVVCEATRSCVPWVTACATRQGYPCHPCPGQPGKEGERDDGDRPSAAAKARCRRGRAWPPAE